MIEYGFQVNYASKVTLLHILYIIILRMRQIVENQTKTLDLQLILRISAAISPEPCFMHS